MPQREILPCFYRVSSKLTECAVCRNVLFSSFCLYEIDNVDIFALHNLNRFEPGIPAYKRCLTFLHSPSVSGGELIFNSLHKPHQHTISLLSVSYRELNSNTIAVLKPSSNDLLRDFFSLEILGSSALVKSKPNTPRRRRYSSMKGFDRSKSNVGCLAKNWLIVETSSARCFDL